MSSRPKRNRKVKKDPWDEHQLMTSEESRLISLDLVVGDLRFIIAELILMHII